MGFGQRPTCGPFLSARGMSAPVKALCTTDDPGLDRGSRKILDDPNLNTEFTLPFVPISPGISKAEPFLDWLTGLERETDKEIERLEDLEAMAKRVNHFHDLGCGFRINSLISSDFPTEQEARRLFEQALAGKDASVEEEEGFDLSSCSICAGFTHPKDEFMQKPGTL